MVQAFSPSPPARPHSAVGSTGKRDFDLWHNLGVEAIILHEQPNQGRTIVEKFENHAVDVSRLRFM
jgi:hypothetical protein